jgi:hypothetical protein
MGNYKSRRPGLLQGWQMDCALMMFQGYKNDEIIEEVLLKGKQKMSDLTQAQKCVYRRRMRNLIKNPTFLDYYKSIITEWSVHNVGPALNKLADQMRSDEPWLVNKAANDVLNRGMATFQAEDSNKVKVEIVNMPDLGSPDD